VRAVKKGQGRALIYEDGLNPSLGGRFYSPYLFFFLDVIYNPTAPSLKTWRSVFSPPCGPRRGSFFFYLPFSPLGLLVGTTGLLSQVPVPASCLVYRRLPFQKSRRRTSVGWLPPTKPLAPLPCVPLSPTSDEGELPPESTERIPYPPSPPPGFQRCVHDFSSNLFFRLSPPPLDFPSCGTLTRQIEDGFT